MENQFYIHNDCCFIDWFSFITHLEFGNQKSIRKRNKTFIPKPQHYGLDGRFWEGSQYEMDLLFYQNSRSFNKNI